MRKLLDHDATETVVLLDESSEFDPSQLAVGNPRRPATQDSATRESPHMTNIVIVGRVLSDIDDDALLKAHGGLAHPFGCDDSVALQTGHMSKSPGR